MRSAKILEIWKIRNNFSMSTESYTCSDCGEIVAVRRKAQHEEFWCTVLVANDDVHDILNDSPNSCSAPSAAMLVHDLNPRLAKIQNIELSSGLSLKFEEVSVFTDKISTGGSLWASEILLAEWLIREKVASADAVLELGCGACPCAGLTAAALEASALCTDKAEVITLAETNLRINAVNVSRARKSQVARENYDTLVYHWGSEIPPRISSLPISVVVMGDCIFNRSTHNPLLESITKLKAVFSFAPPKFILAYQRRGAEEAEFFRLAQDQYNLSTAEVSDVEGLKSKLNLKSPNPHLEMCEVY
ncbi:hypothetical protein TrST_g4718 [Triparma strigata]|uniref:C2HC zinc finger plants domain-containing protein n=1 Tax=Triparma strigata TaxID=1606541 RepID=A0A9W7ALZ4_9STRA|nr:hypothetical protein TrST_g4718 [Triparma strigata]